MTSATSSEACKGELDLFILFCQQYIFSLRTAKVLKSKIFLGLLEGVKTKGVIIHNSTILKTPIRK